MKDVLVVEISGNRPGDNNARPTEFITSDICQAFLLSSLFYYTKKDGVC